jgi:hypothetical protein
MPVKYTEKNTEVFLNDAQGHELKCLILGPRDNKSHGPASVPELLRMSKNKYLDIVVLMDTRVASFSKLRDREVAPVDKARISDGICSQTSR